MKIELRDITDENREQVFALKVAKEQMPYIDSNEASMNAAKENEDVARPFAVYADGNLVGFTMFAFDEEYEDLHGMGMEYLMAFIDDYLKGGAA